MILSDSSDVELNNSNTKLNDFIGKHRVVYFELDYIPSSQYLIKGISIFLTVLSILSLSLFLSYPDSGINHASS